MTFAKSGTVSELKCAFMQSICQIKVKNDGRRQLVSRSLRFANICAPHGATFLFYFDVWDMGPTLSISIGPPSPPLCLSWVKSTYLSSPLATVSTTKPCLLSPLHSSLSSLSSKLFASQSLLVKLLSMQPSDTAHYVVIIRRWRKIKKNFTLHHLQVLLLQYSLLILHCTPHYNQ